MRAAVTGADGFVGTYLCAELELLGFEVSELGLHIAGGMIDLRDGPEIIDHIQGFGPDVIFHLGGVSGPMVTPADPASVASINCSGTVNVFEGAKVAKTPRVVYASSISGFDGGGDRDPYPLTIYGASKRFGEMVARIYQHDATITTVSARIGSVYGRGRQSLDVLDLMLKQAREQGIISYSQDGIVPLIDVTDLAKALAKLGVIKDPPLVCDLVTEVLSECELAHMVAERTGLTANAVVAGGTKSESFPEWRKSVFISLLLNERVSSVFETLDEL